MIYRVKDNETFKRLERESNMYLQNTCARVKVEKNERNVYSTSSFHDEQEKTVYRHETFYLNFHGTNTAPTLEYTRNQAVFTRSKSQLENIDIHYEYHVFDENGHETLSRTYDDSVIGEINEATAAQIVNVKARPSIGISPLSINATYGYLNTPRIVTRIRNQHNPNVVKEMITESEKDKVVRKEGTLYYTESLQTLTEGEPFATYNNLTKSFDINPEYQCLGITPSNYLDWIQTVISKEKIKPQKKEKNHNNKNNLQY